MVDFLREIVSHYNLSYYDFVFLLQCIFFGLEIIFFTVFYLIGFYSLRDYEINMGICCTVFIGCLAYYLKARK